MTTTTTPKVGDEVIFSSDPLADSPQVTALDDDTFILSWESADGDIFARHLDATGSFTSSNFLQGVSDVDSATLLTPIVVQESNGTVETVYNRLATDTNADISVHVSDANFTPDGGSVSDSTPASEGLKGAVAILNGTAAAYETIDASGNEHTSIRFLGTNGKPTSVTDPTLGNPGETGSNTDATMVSSGVDDVYVAYTHFDPATDNTDIRFETVGLSGATSSVIDISGTGNFADFANMAMLTNGSLIVVWQDQTSLVMKLMLPNGIPQAEFRVRDTVNAGADLPKVTALKDGTFLLAWTQQSGTEKDGSPNEDIFLRRYKLEPDGNGGTTLSDDGDTIHLTEPGDQGLFQMNLTTLADGRVLLAYASETGDSTNVNNMVYRIIDPRDSSISGTAGADIIVAQTTASTINGLAGDDTLIGQAGDDTLNGGDGNDTIDGGLGNDHMDGGTGINTVTFKSATAAVIVDLVKGTAVGEGSDTLANFQNITGSDFNDTITANAANNVIDGGAGINTVRFDGVAAAVTVDLTEGTATGQGTDTLLNIQNVTGSALNDTITGDPNSNIIDGGMGNDHLDGGAGIDTAEFLSGSAGVTANLTTGTATGQGNDTLVNFESLVGSNFADTLIGDNGNNTLDGRGGADTMQGLGGNDIYVVDNAADVVIEASGQGNDTVLAGASYTLGAGQSIETLKTTSFSNAAAINLTGNELSQAIIGNAGANFINGGGGNDTLTGLGGADTFVFNTALNATTNVDTITDFDPTADTIMLGKSIFSALDTGPLSADAFFVGTAAHVASDRIIYNQSTGTLTYDSNGSAAGGATVFATLSPNLALHVSNFVVG
jgi:Ca2+-binding RTX toxin-like protein